MWKWMVSRRQEGKREVGPYVSGRELRDFNIRCDSMQLANRFGVQMHLVMLRSRSAHFQKCWQERVSKSGSRDKGSLNIFGSQFRQNLIVQTYLPSPTTQASMVSDTPPAFLPVLPVSHFEPPTTIVNLNIVAMSSPSNHQHLPTIR